MITQTKLQKCPICTNPIRGHAYHCPRCFTDLRLFDNTEEIAVNFYNEALVNVDKGDRIGALEKLNGAIAADSTFVEAYIVAGKLLAQSGKKSDLHEANHRWEKALQLNPTADQAYRIELCRETLASKLQKLDIEQTKQKRNHRTETIITMALVGSACLLGGYFLHSLAPKERIITKVGLPEESITRTASTANPGQMNEPDEDPVEAVRKGINQPSVEIMRNGETLVLSGTIPTVEEKRLIHNAAQQISKLTIDDANLRVVPVYRPVASSQVQKMVTAFVGSVDKDHPLYKADVTISGGDATNPLLVSGNVTSNKAKIALQQLVDKVYPSANDLDVSGVTVVEPKEPAVKPITPPTQKKKPSAIENEKPDARAITTKRRLDEAVSGSIEKDGKLNTPPAIPKPQDRSNTRASKRKPKSDVVYIDVTRATYTVRPGENMTQIAHRFLKTDWKPLWELNKDVVRDPNSLKAGTVLQLPASWQTKSDDE